MKVILAAAAAVIFLVFILPATLPDGWQGRCDAVWQGKWDCGETK